MTSPARRARKRILDIETEPVKALQREQRSPQRVGAEQLEAALGVVDAAQHKQLHEPVEDATNRMTRPRFADARGAGRLPRSNEQRPRAALRTPRLSP